MRTSRTAPFHSCGRGAWTVAGIDVIALRVSFTGDLGWELYCDQDKQVELYRALLASARDLGGGRWVHAP
jgi:glycine cleavage system aminomethyltransferase T